MVRTKTVVGVALASVLSMGMAFAEDAGWSGKAGLGYLATTGNSETSNINAYAEGNYLTGRWHHGLKASVIGAESNKASTAERYEASYQGKFDLRELDYLFGLVRYEKDKFAGVDEQTSETIGYGRRLLKSEKHEWNAELGVGAKQADLRDGSSQDETIARAATDYTWHFNENSKFAQTLAVESGGDNTYLESVTSLTANLVGRLALVTSFTVKSNSDVPAATDDTDTFSSISLEYSF